MKKLILYILMIPMIFIFIGCEEVERVDLAHGIGQIVEESTPTVDKKIDNLGFQFIQIVTKEEKTLFYDNYVFNVYVKVYNYSTYSQLLYADLFDFKFSNSNYIYTISNEKFINESNKNINITKNNPITCYIKFSLTKEEFEEANVTALSIYYQNTLIIKTTKLSN